VDSFGTLVPGRGRAYLPGMSITIGVLFLWIASTIYWAIGSNGKAVAYCGFIATACMAVLLGGAGRGLWLR
jgi:hypothetical protein